MSRFRGIDNCPDEERVEQWVEEFYGGLMNVFNGFFTHIDLKEAIERIKDIPFESLVLDQLVGESEEVRLIARRRVRELAAAEINYLQGYAE